MPLQFTREWHLMPDDFSDDVGQWAFYFEQICRCRAMGIRARLSATAGAAGAGAGLLTAGDKSEGREAFSFGVQSA